MKRSEAIVKVQVLLENRGYVGNNDDGKAVLDLLESIGMLPPPTDIDVVTNNLLYCYYYENGRDSQDNLWEPEDD